MFICAKKKRERKRNKGGPIPYEVEPLKRWMSRLTKRPFGFYTFDHVWPYACFVVIRMSCVLASVCQRLLKHTIVIQESLCALAASGIRLRPLRLLQWVCPIRDQVEAASFIGIMSYETWVFSSCIFFLTCDWKTFKQFQFVYVCIVTCQEEWGKYLSMWLQLLSLLSIWSNMKQFC